MKLLQAGLFIFISLISISSFSQTKRVSLNGGVSLPVGEFSNVYKSGASAQLGFVFYTLPIVNIDLSMNAEFNTFSYKNDYFTNQFSTNLGVPVTGFNPEWSASDFSIMAGGRLKLPGLIMQPYGEVQIGVHFMSFNKRLTGQINSSSSNPSNVSFANSTDTGSETGIGTAFGIGTEISLIPQFSIDAGLKYNYARITYSEAYTVFRNENSQYTNPALKNVTFISARVGIAFGF